MNVFILHPPGHSLAMFIAQTGQAWHDHKSGARCAWLGAPNDRLCNSYTVFCTDLAHFEQIFQLKNNNWFQNWYQEVACWVLSGGMLSLVRRHVESCQEACWVLSGGMLSLVRRHVESCQEACWVLSGGMLSLVRRHVESCQEACWVLSGGMLSLVRRHIESCQ